MNRITYEQFKPDQIHSVLKLSKHANVITSKGIYNMCNAFCIFIISLEN